MIALQSSVTSAHRQRRFATASLTVRGLTDDLKRRLRLRAAGNGRSVEEEIRHIFTGAAARGDEPSRAAAPVRRSFSTPSGGWTVPEQSHDGRSAATTRRALLIIGGGIVAYQSLDLIRRLPGGSIGRRRPIRSP